MNGNVITVVGNLTRDPEVKFTRNGSAMCRISVADNYGWKDKQGEWQTKTSFVDAVAWGNLAEHMGETLTKGTRVIVTGRIDQQQWEAEDGGKRSKLEIEIEAIGPDLRFATASVERSESKGNGRPAPKTPEPDYTDEDVEPF